jgi:hypothetical protein
MRAFLFVAISQYRLWMGFSNSLPAYPEITLVEGIT